MSTTDISEPNRLDEFSPDAKHYFAKDNPSGKDTSEEPGSSQSNMPGEKTNAKSNGELLLTLTNCNRDVPHIFAWPISFANEIGRRSCVDSIPSPKRTVLTGLGFNKWNQDPKNEAKHLSASRKGLPEIMLWGVES